MMAYRNSNELSLILEGRRFAKKAHIDGKLRRSDRQAERILRKIDQNMKSSTSGRRNTHTPKTNKIEKPPTKAAIDRKLSRASKTADRIRKDTKKNKPKRQWDSEAFENKQLNDENACFHHLYVCRDKGRDGSPTYDKGGYELDYDKVMTWFNRSVAGGKLDCEQKRHDEEKMRDMFFEKGAAPDCDPGPIDLFMVNAWKARVEEDTGVPHHKIGVEDFEEWQKRGFSRAKKGEYQDFDGAERKRLLSKSEGSAFRK